jgi:hypothetical protein
LEVSF